jgi:hypothetical protein
MYRSICPMDSDDIPSPTTLSYTATVRNCLQHLYQYIRLSVDLNSTKQAF